jgi:membrane protein implicated in regulation of membrane protease activity
MRVVFLNGPARVGGWRGVLAMTVGLAVAAVLAVMAFTVFLVALPFAAVGAWLIRRRLRKVMAEMQERQREARAAAFAEGRAPSSGPQATIIDAEYRVINRE